MRAEDVYTLIRARRGSTGASAEADIYLFSIDSTRSMSNAHHLQGRMQTEHRAGEASRCHWRWTYLLLSEFLFIQRLRHPPASPPPLVAMIPTTEIPSSSIGAQSDRPGELTPNGLKPVLTRTPSVARFAAGRSPRTEFNSFGLEAGLLIPFEVGQK